MEFERRLRNLKARTPYKREVDNSQSAKNDKEKASRVRKNGKYVKKQADRKRLQNRLEELERRIAPNKVVNEATLTYLGVNPVRLLNEDTNKRIKCTKYNIKKVDESMASDGNDILNYSIVYNKPVDESKDFTAEQPTIDTKLNES